MKILYAIVLCLFYVVAVVSLGSALSQTESPWLIEALLSLLFLLAYRRLVRGHLVIPFAVVFVVTSVLPIAVLLAAGMPAYHTLGNTSDSLYRYIREQGLFWWLELFAPFLVTAAEALILRWRSIITFKRGAP